MSILRRGLIIGGAIFAAAFGIVAILMLIATGRALMLEEFPSYANFAAINYSIPEEEANKYTDIMGKSIQFKTISTSPTNYDREELLRLHDFLRKSFPLVYNSSYIDVETVNTYSLLFTVKGDDPAPLPFMLTSHLDVVPVDPEQWSKPPFLGEVVLDPETGEPCVWGRGTLDDKIGVVGILSALESLLSSGWTPKRNFFVAFGHDEEVSGFDGAGHIAKVLEERNVQLDFLLDEGMPIVQGILGDMIDEPVALIGVTEKGWAEVKISVEGIGGHSSVPPTNQAVQKLSAALNNLYRYPQPSMFGSGPEIDMLRYMSPKIKWPYKLFTANLWLFGPLVSRVLSRQGETNALVRTTTAVTIVSAGYKTNVVPASAFAIVNHRVHPSQTLEEVLAHDEAAIGDSDVKLDMYGSVEPQPVSPYGPDSIPYQLIAGAVKHVYPDAITVPSLVVGNTDTRHYLNFTRNIYRLLPFVLNKSQVRKIHGKDENISTKNFESVVKFFRLIITGSQSLLSDSQEINI